MRVCWLAHTTIFSIISSHIFIVQVYSQALACFASYGAFRYWVSNEEHRKWVIANGRVTGEGKDWGGTSANTYYNASLIWGAIGAKRFFFDTQYASIIIGGAVIGAITPVLLWLLHKGTLHHHLCCLKTFCSFCLLFTAVGGTLIQLIHPAILLSPISPGYNQGWVLSSLVLGAYSQWFLYRKRTDWWQKYNYVRNICLRSITWPLDDH